jgi:hypothetical protein
VRILLIQCYSLYINYHANVPKNIILQLF